MYQSTRRVILVSYVTKQLTLFDDPNSPVFLRPREMGVKPRDKVAFIIEDGGVRLGSAPFSLDLAYGSVKPVEMPEDFLKISREVKDAKAEKTARESFAV